MGCLPSTCQLYMFQWPPVDITTAGGRGVLGPKVNKFEQVSNDDHQMSVVQVPMFQCIMGNGHPLPLNRMTDSCENIAFPQLRLRAVITVKQLKSVVGV